MISIHSFLYQIPIQDKVTYFSQAPETLALKLKLRQTSRINPIVRKNAPINPIGSIAEGCFALTPKPFKTSTAHILAGQCKESDLEKREEEGNGNSL